MKKKYKININLFAKIAIILLASFFLYIFVNPSTLPCFLFNEVLPYYTISANDTMKITKNTTVDKDNHLNKLDIVDEYEEITNEELEENLIQLNENLEKTSIKQNLINTKNVEYKSEEYYSIDNQFDNTNLPDNLENIKDLEYLKNNFYIVDTKTDISSDIFKVNDFLNKDLSIEKSTKPKILIFNTHGNEVYKDSKDLSEGVQGLGTELAKILDEKYEIMSMQNFDEFDKVDKKTQILGAYDRMAPVIKKTLEENPSIEMVIDIHRDGLPDNVHLVTEINGKDTAQIMLVNGLSKIYENGILTDITSLPNPNIQDNLALSFKMKVNGNEMYPNFMRKIYLHAYRYSLHMKPLSLLVEVGAQTNTYEEAKNAMEPLADIIASVILE